MGGNHGLRKYSWCTQNAKYFLVPYQNAQFWTRAILTGKIAKTMVFAIIGKLIHKNKQRDLAHQLLLLQGGNIYRIS